MKERPILFSAPMVRAILEGRKTVTRRVVKNFGVCPKCWNEATPHNGKNAILADGSCYLRVPFCDENDICGKRITCPYGQPGDRLWVREAFRIRAEGQSSARFEYRADLDWNGCSGHRNGLKWKPSIHMPRWASRIDLEVTAVRAERVQDITDESAKAEGPPHRCASAMCDCNYNIAITDFARLWDSINAKRGFSWESNPWVWVVEFKRLTDARD